MRTGEIVSDPASMSQFVHGTCDGEEKQGDWASVLEELPLFLRLWEM